MLASADLRKKTDQPGGGAQGVSTPRKSVLLLQVRHGSPGPHRPVQELGMLPGQLRELISLTLGPVT